MMSDLSKFSSLGISSLVFSLLFPGMFSPFETVFDKNVSEKSKDVDLLQIFSIDYTIWKLFVGMVIRYTAFGKEGNS